MTTQSIGAPLTTPSRLVAAEIRAEMARQGISGRDMAKRLHKDSSWVSRHIGINASTALSLEDIVEMTEALGVSAERFLIPLLPRLDSNQQPSGYRPSEEPLYRIPDAAPVVDLFTRERVA